MIGDDEMTSHLIILGGALGPRLRGWVGAVGAELEVAVHELHARRELLDHLLGLGLVGVRVRVRVRVRNRIGIRVRVGARVRARVRVRARGRRAGWG